VTPRRPRPDLPSDSETTEGGSPHQEICRRNGLQKLDEIIGAVQRSLQETLEDDPWKAERLGTLAFMHLYRYTLAKDESDREKSARVLALALSLTSERSRSRVELHERLGGRHAVAYQTTNSEHHLQAAIDHWASALEGTPDDHPKIPLQLLNLGEMYMQRSFRYGNADDFERARCLLWRGLEDPKTTDLIRQRLLVSISHLRPMALFTRSDLEAAMRGYNEWLQLAPQGSEHRVRLLTGLGSAHLKRYDRDNSLRDLEIGVQHLEDAITQASGVSCDISYTHMHLATARVCFFTETTKLYDIDKAIAHYHEALNLGRQNVSARPNFLSRLSDAYKIRYSATKDPSDLDKAAAALKDALDQTPSDHPGRVLLVRDYTDLLLRSHGGMTGTTKDDRYLRPLQEGLDQPIAMTISRISVALLWPTCTERRRRGDLPTKLQLKRSPSSRFSPPNLWRTPTSNIMFEKLSA
jgi:tetratricopeptide (TPR) repeat protein